MGDSNPNDGEPSWLRRDMVRSSTGRGRRAARPWISLDFRSIAVRSKTAELLALPELIRSSASLLIPLSVPAEPEREERARSLARRAVCTVEMTDGRAVWGVRLQVVHPGIGSVTGDTC